MTKAQHTVLLDLSMALKGYAGIPQDTRLTFKTMSMLDNVQAAGVLIAASARALKCIVNDNSQRSDNIMAQAGYLSAVLNGDHGYSHITLLRRIQKLRDMRLLNKSRAFSLSKIDAKVFSGMIWRKYFSDTLTHEDFDLITSQNFYATNFNMRSMVNAMNKNYEITLDTSAWDFMIFQDSRPVTLSKNTTKIIRYHDTIPLFDLDLVNEDLSSTHSQTLSKCKNDSIYVCNSEPTREALIDIIPELENRSYTVPYALSNVYKKSIDSNILKNIFIQRLSSIILEKSERNIRAEKINHEGEFKYILALATFDPKKNYVSLVRAWELLRNKKRINHKLVIVANQGWKDEEIKNAMKAGINSGDIIHLEKIPPEEISYLYSHASAFVFPSYTEGFGFPPIEAMQCECPVVASDIKPHRWVMGDAALYCNPYSVDSIAEAIEQLVASENAEGLRQDLIAKGLKRIQLYHLDVISQQWQELFDKLKAKSPIQQNIQ